MKKTLLLLLLMASTLFSQEAKQVQHRAVEISSRVGPLVGEIRFFDDSVARVPLFVHTIKGERFDWCHVPTGATRFSLKFALLESEMIKLTGSFNPYVVVTSAPTPAEPNVNTLQYSVNERPRIFPENHGWVLFGGLTSGTDNSDWEYIYLAKSDMTPFDSPNRQAFLYDDLEALVKGDSTQEFIVDFPLYFLTAPAGDYTGAPLIRAGQKIKIEEVSPSNMFSNRKVYVKVMVLSEAAPENGAMGVIKD